MATNGWIGEQTVHSWGTYNSRLTTNVYINGIRRYSDHIDVSGVIYLFCKSSGARTVWYDWAITAWCGGGNLGQIKPRTYNNNILGKSWSKNFSIRINCSNSATSATFQVGFSDSNMGGKDKYWTLYFDRYATSPSGISSTATYTQYSTISTSCSGINWGQGYSNRSLTCTASYTYNGKTENFTLGTWTDGATSKSVTKTDFNFPADLNVTVKWTASTNIGSTSSTTQVRAKQTFPAPNLSNTTFTAESTAPYCIRVNVSGVDFGDNYSAQKLELYGTYELDGIIYDNKLGEISNQTSWTLEYDASQEAEPWTKIPDDSSILLRLVADNGNRTSDKTIIINCQSSYEAYVIEHIPEEEKEKSETYTGKNIQIQDAPEGAPLSSVQVNGNTAQQTYTGKNLFKPSVVADGTVSGVTFGHSADGSLINITTGSGSSSAAIDRMTHISLSDTPSSLIESGNTYTLSTTAPLPNGARVAVLAYSATSWLADLVILQGNGSRTSVSAAVTIPSAATRIRWGVHIDSGISLNLQNLGIQFEKNSSATSFEPFVGGVPAPNPDYPQAVQTVTGENVVKICGKNLLDVKNNLKASDGGLNFSYSNDKLVVSGTPTRSYANVTNEINTFLAAGQYTLSLSEAVSHRVYIWVRYTDGAAASLGIINAGGTSVTTTFAKDVAQIRLDFSVITTGVALSESFSVQLELGSSASSFEPYQGQSYEVNLGKNLFDKSAATDGYRLDASGAPYADYTFTLSDYIPVKPNTTYTISYGSAIPSYAHVASYGSDKTFIYRWYIGATSSFTLTTQANAYYVRLAIPIGKKDTTQCELGSQATSYAPYFTPIELCKIGDYQDYIWNDNGTWKVHLAVGSHTFIGNSSEAWSGGGAGTTSTNYTYIYTSYLDSVAKRGVALICDRMIGITGEIYRSTNVTSDTIGIMNTTGNDATRAFVLTSRLSGSTTAAWRTWLASNPITVYYALATPTDTEITNEVLVEQLEILLNAARTYAGVNNITTITPNEQGTLEIQYYTKWQNTSPVILSANGRNGTGNFKQVRRIGTK